LLLPNQQQNHLHELRTREPQLNPRPREVLRPERTADYRQKKVKMQVKSSSSLCR